MNEEQIFSEIRAALPALVGQEKRMRHILGVEQEAKALSELFCEAGLLQKGEAKKLRLAALVHDITKTKTTEEQLQLCREYGIATDARLQNSSKLLHAYTGGPYAAQRFGTEWIDGDVQRAVRYHTTGRAGMDLLEKLLFSSYKGETIEGVIEIVRAKEKLSDLTAMLQTVIEGEIITDQNNEFYLRSDNYDEPISFHNLSTGMKSFVILKMLIEKGCLKDKDVLILDEPEIHLHPQWQIAYAELIVLLQKQFDLSVVVTTHSPYFVDALNLFSCKYGTDKKVNYYLSANHDNTVVMENVTENIDLIYKKMATPIQMLDTLRYELNNN